MADSPDFLPSLVNGALCNAELQQYAAAEERLRRALRLSPRSPAVLNNWGRLMISTGRYSDALAAFQAALAVQPDNPLFRANAEQAHALLAQAAT